MTTLIADCETNGLLKEMTKLHCVQIGSEDGDDARLYGDNDLCDAPLSEGLARLRSADRIVGHNFLGFDLWAINHFHPGTIRFEQVYDTLVLARMHTITERRHSLRDWGLRLGCHKGDYKGDYQTFDQEFADYSRQDIVVGRKLWHAVKDVLAWGGGTVYETEAKSAYCCARQEQNGVAFDVEAAQQLHAQLMQEKNDLLAEIKTIFPDFKREQTFVPKVNSTKYGYKKGVPFTKKWDDAFNPRSRDMIAEALQRDGWTPKVFTETGKPKVDEETLTAVDHPGAKLLTKYLKTSKIIGSIVGEKQGKGYLQLVKSDGRLYGRVNTLGATTWRMAHSNPNLANIDKDKRVRSLFIATPGWKLVGCDGREIQARFLAHYLHRYDGGLYAEKLLKGDKAKGTDGHTLNLRSMEPYGLVSRDGSKTALYARIFGARAPRMFATINEDRRKHDKPQFAETEANIRKYGQGGINALGRSMPGLDDLLKDVQATGKDRGWLKGIGGAQVPCSAAHAALVSLLQHGEAVAMKTAQGIIEFETAPARGWVYGRDYRYVTNVHDEVQSETIPEIAAEYGQAFDAAIEEAGRRLSMRCPLGGEHKIGDNWYDTH